MPKRFFALSCLLVCGFAVSAKADTVLDPLHGFCYGTTSCTDNGTNTPTTLSSPNPPQFGFDVSPSPQTGTFYVDFLVQTNATNKPASIVVDGTQGGSSNTSNLSGTATLVSSTPWSSGDLDTYLGISSSPANPFGAFTVAPGSTGFDVYQVDLGTNQLFGPSDATSGPLLSLMAGLPIDTYIVGFLNTGTTGSPNFIATTNSGAILETKDPAPPAVPEPGSLLLVCTGLVGAAATVRRTFAN